MTQEVYSTDWFCVTDDGMLHVDWSMLDKDPEAAFAELREAASVFADGIFWEYGALDGHLRHEVEYPNDLEMLKRIRENIQYIIIHGGTLQRPKPPKNSPEARRNEFNRKRDKLALKMIKRGDPYQCSIDGCDDDDITIDHIIDLAKGGSNELSNLRFLCRSHNSAKRD